MTVLELLDRGLEALRDADPVALMRLAEAAGGAEMAQSPDERACIRSRRRTAEVLLALTARNIRVLRGERGFRNRFGALQS